MIKNPLRELKQLRKIVDYYEGHMLDLMRCQKYKEQGRLLLSNSLPGETVYLIGANAMDLFDEAKKCVVEMVEFIGNNNSVITLRDVDSAICYKVHNRQCRHLFFFDAKEASVELERRLRFGEEKEIFCG